MDFDDRAQRTRPKGRGALTNPGIRFERMQREAIDDGWGNLEESPPPLETTVGIDHAKSILAWNDSPDVPFDRSINPYRGCEHGCIYCFARPSHAYYGLSPGQDFETRLLRKAHAAERLEEELRHPGYKPAPITLGANTDPYQPIERQYRVTRELLQVLHEYRHPVSIVTKGTLIERDLELLSSMADWNGVSVFISITSLRASIKRALEPRAASHGRRLQLVQRLSENRIPTGVLIAPVIPAITDDELEAIVYAAAHAGARTAGYVLLRLPREVRALFTEWLEAEYPDRAQRVLNLLRQAHDGRSYDPTFGNRQRGTGVYAEMLARRFQVATRKTGLTARHGIRLSSTHFRVPARRGDQIRLFQ